MRNSCLNCAHLKEVDQEVEDTFDAPPISSTSSSLLGKEVKGYQCPNHQFQGKPEDWMLCPDHKES